MVRDVKVVYRKLDGSLHWHLTTRWLGEDEHGVWTGIARPTAMRKGDGPLVRLDYASVLLFPRDAWWTAAFNDAPAETEIYCDITTPVRWPSAGEVTMVDLDLDVSRRRTGEVEVWDEDEFAAHQRKYGYPADVVAAAERSAEWLRDALTRNHEPFASVYRAYLALVTAPPSSAASGRLPLPQEGAEVAEVAEVALLPEPPVEVDGRGDGVGLGRQGRRPPGSGLAQS